MSSPAAVTTPVAGAPSRYTPSERDELLREHLGLVHLIARRLSRRLSLVNELDELVSAGMLGLMQAIDSFDAARGLAFSTYAAPRIRGAILDELRRLDHAPRSVRRQARDIDAARDALATASGRAPSDAEIAERLGVELETLWRWQRNVAGMDHDSIDLPAGGAAGSLASRSSTHPSVLPELATSDAEGADARLVREERFQIVRDAIQALREQQRVVLSMYYFEELPLAEIAPVLGVTESRVCQIHRKALQTLRDTLHAPLGLAA